MTKQDMIIERLDIIIKLLSPKKNNEPLITLKLTQMQMIALLLKGKEKYLIV